MRALNKFFSMSRRQQLVVLLILALLMFVVFRIVQAKTLASRAKAPEVTAIQIKTSEIIQLQSTSFDKTLSLSGALDPYQQAVVSARASGEVQEVRGLGVVGRQPLLQPGEQFVYTSGCQLDTPVGTMRGSYQFTAVDGRQFEADIAEFTLAVPHVLH